MSSLARPLQTWPLFAALLLVQLTLGTSPASARPFDPAHCNTISSIPAEQQLQNALAAMNQEQATEFTFEPYPDLGVFTHEIFIKEALVKLEGNARQYVLDKLATFLGAHIYGRGDGRQHDANFSPTRVRAMVVLDFEKGRGFIIANSTGVIVKDFKDVFQLGEHTFTARKPADRWKGGGSWFRADWVDENTFRLRYDLLEGVWGSEHAIDAISAQMLIDRRTGNVRFQHDRFPSYGTYQYKPCSSTPIERDRSHQEQLSNLGDSHDWQPYDVPHSGWKPTLPSRPPRIMVVGDSISHGNSGDFTWRYRLHEHLRSKGIPFDFVGPRKGPHTGNYAAGGWDDDHNALWGRAVVEEKNTIGALVAEYQPDVLLVHLGTNDLSWWGGTPESVANDMLRFVENARRAKADIDIVIATIGDTQPIADGTIAKYNDLLWQLGSLHSRPGASVTLAEVAWKWSHQTDTYDGTHPNVHGEYVIAKAMADTLYGSLNYGQFFGEIPVALAPPKPARIVVSPDTIKRGQSFTVSWDRVVNPGIWTEYLVQVRYHEAFGFGLIWETPASTPNTSVTYSGPKLPQVGTYHVVVVARDIHGQMTRSDPVPLHVNDFPAPPPAPSNIRVTPGLIGREGGFLARWDRVVNPGIWTEYKVQLRYHQNFGFGLLWESASTPNTELMYDGPTLPQIGTYHVVIVARDQFAQETLSAPVPLGVQQAVPPPLAPGNVKVSSPGTIWRNGGFTVTWERVINPKIWTEYRVQVRNHQDFGFGLIWESGSTPNLSVTYSGPYLPRAGVYHVVVVARDQHGQETMSGRVPLTVQDDPPPPPPPTNVRVTPSTIAPTSKFTVAWDRVTNPGIWTEYQVQVRHHQSFGFALVWQSSGTTPNLSLDYTGLPLEAGTYHVVVVAQDQFGKQRMSVPVPLTVM